MSHLVPPQQTTWDTVMLGKSGSPSVSWIKQDYSTELDARALFNYYEKELSRNGWEFRQEYVITAPSPFAQFSTEKVCEYGCSRTYCKDSHSAVIDYHHSGQYYVSLRNDEFRTCDDIDNPNTSMSEALHRIAFPFWWFGVVAGFIILQKKLSNHKPTQMINKLNGGTRGSFVASNLQSLIL